LPGEPLASKGFLFSTARRNGKKYILQRTKKHDKLDHVASAASK
jgi:hypothetical protein